MKKPIRTHCKNRHRAAVAGPVGRLLAIGPRLADGSYLVLAGTDSDFSNTQNASSTQFEVYFK